MTLKSIFGRQLFGSDVGSSNSKICLDTNCRRAGQLLPVTEYSENKRRSDGRNYYCRECAARRTRAYRERKNKLKPNMLASVESAIAEGSKSREEIQEYTRLDYDTLGEILAELVWERQSVKIERVGSQRQFVIAA